MKYDTTIVITSFDRHDLLERTLRSLRIYNTDQRCGRLIVVEDSDANPQGICDKYGAELILVGPRIGQPSAIDRAYSLVTTPYIFHSEDDYEFYRTGFIEKSREILEIDKSCVCVWIRPWDDIFGHPLSFKSPCRTFGVPDPDSGNHGFTFNAGLRRLSDYLLIGPYTRFSKLGFQAEPAIGREYRKLGYRGVILDETGYVRDIGKSRHTLPYIVGGFRGTDPAAAAVKDRVEIDFTLPNLALGNRATQSSLSGWLVEGHDLGR
jgi:hypothetical protein